MVYADSQVAGDGLGVGQLVAARLDEHVVRIKPTIPKQKRQPAKKNQEHA